MTADGGSRKRLTVESPAMSIDLSFDDGDVDTLRLCTPTGPTGWAFVQKVAGVAAVGTARTADTLVDFAAADAQAHHDYTTGFLRAETWWHWACIAARLDDGRRLGLNLSCGTNESGYRENGGWIDDHWFALDGALFDFDPDEPDGPWRISGPDNGFELSFLPARGYHSHHDSATMASNFRQLFGTFSGWIQVPDGERLVVNALPGFAETQYLRW